MVMGYSLLSVSLGFMPSLDEGLREKFPFLQKKKARRLSRFFGKDKIYRAALAFSTREVKAAMSDTASSASIFRFRPMPAFFRPFMKRE